MAKRYIDADKLINDINYIDSCELNDDEKCIVFRTIRQHPTADVVEVVRCKDCVHGEFGIFNGQGEKDGCYCNLNGEGYDLDWYCKGGKRRTDNV